MKSPATSPPRVRVVDTPLGPMRLHVEGGALTGAWFLDQDECPASPPLPAGGASSRPAESRTSFPDTSVSETSMADASAFGTPIRRTPIRDTAIPDTAIPDTAIPEPAISDAVLDRAALELAEYFAGCRREFSLAMATHGTPFQRRVWDALRDIPFGGLESYGALSERCAQAAAVRAVAQAVGHNPISIFIPCHRIVGSNGALTGFGGGLPRKQALLALEGHLYATASPAAKRIEKDPRQGDLW